jgi:hypothetical protein
MAAMTCVSLHGGACFFYARETGSIAAVLRFCVDETDCMTVLSDYNISSKETSLGRSDQMRQIVAENRILSAERGRVYSNLSGMPAHPADSGDTRGQTAGGFSVLIFGVGDYLLNIGTCGEVIERAEAVSRADTPTLQMGAMHAG